MQIYTALPIAQLFMKSGTPATPAPGGAAAASVRIYPVGTIFVRSTKFPGKFRIAIPRGVAAGLGGLGVMSASGACLFGDCGLGAPEAPFTEDTPIDAGATPQTAAGPAQEAPTDKKFEKNLTVPLYKRWQFWAAVGGGTAVVLGGGGYWFIRRRKKAARSA
jgi:LPXTG-motif cell wall-anchored protein